MASRASLNHTYRTVWNAALGSMVAVAETAPSHAGGTSCAGVCAGEFSPVYRVAGLTALSLGIALGLGGWAASARANPTGATAIVGQANLSTQGNKLTVTTQNGLGLNHSAINWQSFSIPAGSSTHFQQPNAASTSINRVVSNTPSQIFGALSSNGRLVLVNQAGITVGAGAVVDTAGFTASSLRMSDADALAGRLRFGDATVSGATVNVQGSILARTSDAVLIGSNIEVGRDALIQAPNGSTLLAAGQQVELTGPGLEGIRLQVQAPTDRALNLGTLQGDAVGIFAGTLRHSGQIRADAVTVEGGRVVLKAGSQLAVDGQASAMVLGQKGGSIHATAPDVRIESSARLDASGSAGGGEVLVGGGYQGRDPRLSNAFSSQIDSDAELRADATAQGHGGIVVVWADDTASVHGNLSARGGPLGGDGGFIETSGKRLLAVSRAADASAPAGRAGTWLLDPFDITIDIGGTGTLVNGNPQTFTSATSSSTISASTINTALNAGTSVTISTGDGAGSSQPGNITVLGAIEKTSGIDASLTLNAHNNIDILANVSGVGTGGKLHLVLNPDSDANGSGASTVGDYPLTTNFVNVQNLTSTGPLQVLSGGLTVQGTASVAGQLSVQGGTATLNGASTLTSLEIAGGTFAGTGNVAVSGSFSQTGGTLGGSGTLTLNGNANTWSGGSWTGGGTTVLAPDAALTLGNTYYFSPNMAGRTLQINSGATATIQRELGVIGGDNTIDVKSGGTLQFSPFNTGYGGAVTSSGIVTSGTGALTIANAGSVVVQPGTNAYLDSYVDPVSHPGVLFTVNSPGAVTVGDGGSLDLYSSYGPQAMSVSLAGALAVGTGATLSNDGAVLNISPASVTTPGYSFSGTLAAYNGDTTLTVPTGNTANIGAINISGGTLLVNGDVQTPAFSQSGGVFSGSGTLTLNGNANTWSGGSWTGGGTTVLAPGAALTLGNTYYFSPNMDGRTLQINSGATATIQRELGVIGGDNTIDVKSGGTLQFSPFNTGYGGSVTSSGIVTSGTGALTIANAGSIVVQPGTSAYLDSYVDPVSHPGVLFTVNSPGAVTVGDGGSLDLYSSYGPEAMSASLAGALAVGTGATLSNNGAALTITPSSASNFSLAGMLGSSGGSTNLNLANAGAPTIEALDISGGTVSLTGAASTNQLSQTGGTLAGSGTLTLNAGAVHSWSDGTWGGGGTTVVGSGATLTMGGQDYRPSILEGRTLSIGSGASVVLNGGLRFKDGLNEINVNPGGTLRFEQVVAEVVPTVSIGNDSVDTGSLAINNSGAIEVHNGSTYLGNYSESPGALLTLAGPGSLNLSAAQLVLLANSSPEAFSVNLTGPLSVGRFAKLENTSAALRIAPSSAPNFSVEGQLFSSGGSTILDMTNANNSTIGELDIHGGTTHLIGAVSTSDLNQTAGILTGTGTLSLLAAEGSHRWSGGSWSGGGVTELRTGADLRIIGGVLYPQLDGRALAIGSGASVRLIGDIDVRSDLNQINVNNGGTLKFAASGGIRNPHLSNGSLAINNAGTIQVLAGVSAYLESYAQSAGPALSLNGPGSLTLDTGSTLELGSYSGSPAAVNVNVTGPLNVASGATLSNSNATVSITPSSAADFSVAGTLSSLGGSTTLNLANANNPTIGALDIIGGTVSLTGAASTNWMDQSGGTLAGNGTLTLNGPQAGAIGNSGLHSWSGGSWTDGGITQLAMGANLTIGGGYGYPTLEGHTLSIGNGAVADVKGSLDVVSGSNTLEVKPGGELRFSASSGYGGGGFQMQGYFFGETFSTSEIYANGGALSIENAGLIKVSGVAAQVSSAASDGSGITLTGAGNVRVEAESSLEFSAFEAPQAVVAGITGSLTLEPGAALRNTGATLSITPIALTAPSGQLFVLDGLTNLNFSQLASPVLGTLTVNGGNVSLQGNASVSAMSQSGGNLSGSGSLTATGSFSQSSGSIELANFTASQTNGPMTVAGSILTNGNLTLSATQGGLRITTNAMLEARAGGNIHLTGAGAAVEGGDEVGVRIAGAVRVDSGSLNVSGVGGGDLQATGGGYNDGVRMDSGALLQSNSGSIVVEGIRGNDRGYYNRGVRLEPDSSIQTLEGDVTIRGNLASTGGGLGNGDAMGVSIAGSITTGSGAVNITGYGSGASTGTFHRGVEVEGAAQISTGSGAISLRGYGGAGAGNGYGVDIDIESVGSPSISSATGRIAIHGTRHASATGTNNDGVRIDVGAVVESGALDTSTSPAIAITGDGSNSLASDFNKGIRLAGTVRTTGSGSIGILGIGGGNRTGNYGVELTGSTVESLSGNVTLHGTGAGTQFDNVGVYLSDALVQSDSGAINILGTASASAAGSGYSHGIVLEGSLIRGRTSPLNMVGVANTLPGNEGIYAYGAEFELGSSVAIRNLAGSSFWNDGNFNVSGYSDPSSSPPTVSGGELALNFLGKPVQNNYGMSLNGANLRLKAGTHLVNVGVINVASGSLFVDELASLRLEPGTLTVASGSQLSGQGTVEVLGGTVNLNGAAAVGSLTMTSGGLSGTGTLTVNGNFSQNAGTSINLHDVDITQTAGSLSIGNLSALNSVKLSASAGSVTLRGSVAAGDHVHVGAFGGDLNIAYTAGYGGEVGSIAAYGQNKAVILATTGNFQVSNPSQTTLSTPHGSWVVYSTNPALDNRGNLAFDFKQYGVALPSQPSYSGPGVGNGFVYSVNPTLNAVLSGSATKDYNGTLSAPSGALNVSVDGAIDSDILQVSVTGASYADKKAGSLKPVIATLSSLSATDVNGRPVYGYQLPSTVSENVGTINRRSLTVGVTGNHKVYDGTASAGVTFSDDRISGDVLTLSSTANFGDKNVGTGKSISVAGISVSGADALNYTLANTSATTTADITARTLNVSATGSNKVYDGGVVASVSLSDNRVSGDTLTLSNSTATFGDKNVGTGKSISVAGISVSGADVGNYTLANTSAMTSANISVRPLATWTAGSVNGQWSNAANWDALPDASNVSAVSIPAGASVNFDAAVGNTQVQSITSAGALNVSGGSLGVSAALTTAQFSQSGGSLNGAGSFTATNSFNQTGGAIAMGGPVNVTQTQGNLQVGSITAPAINLNAVTGSISQVGGLVTTGLLETRSAGATILSSVDNRIASFRSTVAVSGNLELTNLGAIDVKGIDSQAGNVALTNTGGISNSGLVVARGGDISMTANSPLTIGGAGIQASGNITLTATNLTSAGNMTLLGNVSSTGGAITLNAANNFVQNGAVAAALGVSASAGGTMVFGSQATTVGNPVTYFVNGVAVAPPPESLGEGQFSQSNVVADFLQQFEEVLVSTDTQSATAEEDKEKEKQKARRSVVVEAPTCPR